jgi:hypothetical protein
VRGAEIYGGPNNFAAPLPVFRRPTQFCDASRKTKTRRTILRRLAVKLCAAPKITAAQIILRRLSQFFDEPHSFATPRLNQNASPNFSTGRRKIVRGVEKLGRAVSFCGALPDS